MTQIILELGLDVAVEFDGIVFLHGLDALVRQFGLVTYRLD